MYEIRREEWAGYINLANLGIEIHYSLSIAAKGWILRTEGNE